MTDLMLKKYYSAADNNFVLCNVVIQGEQFG